jgi:Sec-independent protein translocase protein TatA
MSAYVSAMTDIKKEIKNAEQDLEAKAQTAKDHAEGKPSSETLNKAKVKVEDAVEDVKRDI